MEKEDEREVEGEKEDEREMEGEKGGALLLKMNFGTVLVLFCCSL